MNNHIKALVELFVMAPLNYFVSLFATKLWQFSEFFNISLGRFGPFVFGLTRRKKGVKIESNDL